MKIDIKRLTLLVICFVNFNCADAPKIDVCLSNAKDGLECHDQRSGKDHFLPYLDTENYLCISPDDARLLYTWIKMKCMKEMRDTR